MQIQEIISCLEQWAPPSLQESYDNSGLLTGHPGWNCTGVVVSLDATEAVVEEAAQRGCNLVVTHHPIIFKGLKRLTGQHYAERTVIKAIQLNIALYAIHTNLDNVLHGVSAKMAERIGLQALEVLAPMSGQLCKLHTFVPIAQAEQVRSALFAAGGGQIGNYSECSFSVAGTGTFNGGTGTQPFVGTPGQRHEEPEIRIELIFPKWLQGQLLRALRQSHPYEEVAYDIVPLANSYASIGCGVIGKLPKPMTATSFLALLQERFGTPVIRHSRLLEKQVQRVALCGGAGSFLTPRAIAAGADVFVTADLKYHEFFDAEDRLVLADLGHWESEQFTIELLHDYLTEKFPTFAVLKSGVVTNPVQYYS